jgi:hypothetical protein
MRLFVCVPSSSALRCVHFFPASPRRSLFVVKEPICWPSCGARASMQLRSPESEHRMFCDAGSYSLSHPARPSFEGLLNP